MSAKKEKLIKITKDRDSSEVGVYEEFDPDNHTSQENHDLYTKKMTMLKKLKCNHSK